MAYRIELGITSDALSSLSRARGDIDSFFQPLVSDALDILKEHAVQNVSGVPFTSETGTHTIHKRTGKLAASIQVQAPYGSPYRGRLFASAKTWYANNPEEWDYGVILEYGRGEVVPKYTPTAKAGFVSKARLTIPGGSRSLAHGENGFRGITGQYRFVSKLPPMEGKFWMAAAAKSSAGEIQAHASNAVNNFLEQHGLGS